MNSLSNQILKKKRMRPHGVATNQGSHDTSIKIAVKADNRIHQIIYQIIFTQIKGIEATSNNQKRE